MAKPNELYHHGVMGMKWGKRNGPPYPLDAQGKAQLREQKKIENKKIKEETKKITFKDYNDQDKHRLVKNTAIGTVIGGPVLGIAVGLITDNSIRKGKAIANLYSDKKVSELTEKKLTKDQINEIGKEILKTKDEDLTDEAMIKMIETQKRKNKPKSSDEEINRISKENHAEFLKKRSSFSSDERKDLWEDAYLRGNKQLAQRIEQVEKSEKTYKSPNNGKYDLTFLEAIQNSEILALGDHKSMDIEYEKYKADPEYYWKVHADKLKQI